MEILTSFDELEARLAEAEQRRAVSDDAFRDALRSWCLSPEIFGRVPDDPFSPEYTRYQMDIYRRLTGHEYQLSYEGSDFDSDRELQRPYPYGTQSSQTVGNHLVGYGWLIRTMDLHPGARVLEIGSGFGALTFHLAAMGYRVTCLDINPQLLEFVRARTSGLPSEIETICGDMATVEIEGTYDAAIFNASLHHTIAHRDVIRRMDDVLAPEGIIVFAAEPVESVRSQSVPYPWGIRLAGLSVWSVAKWGWLELGFQVAYFVKFVQDAGWSLTNYHLAVGPHANVWIARRGKPGGQPRAVDSDDLSYALDPESELIRLRRLVRQYEEGRFIRFMKWLRRFR